MECMKCKGIMFQATLNADPVGTGVYLTNKKKGLLESEKWSGVTVLYVQTADMLN